MRNFGVLVFPDAEELDFVGPWEMVTMWQKVAGGPENCLVVAETMAPVVCAKGLSVNPHASFDSCPPLDVLLVPGGQGTRREVGNAALVGFVADQARACSSVLSVCTGSFVLHAAGVSAGIDLMLAFIAATAGEDAAGKVQFAAEYYPSDEVYGSYTSDPRAPAYVRAGSGSATPGRG